jgi:hypothetical protein
MKTILILASNLKLTLALDLDREIREIPDDAVIAFSVESGL